jgi:hypothetical protein
VLQEKLCLLSPTAIKLFTTKQKFLGKKKREELTRIQTHWPTT